MSDRDRTASIREYLLEHASAYKDGLVASTAEHFNVSRQAIHNHVKQLLSEQKLKKAGNTRAVFYEVVRKNVLFLALSLNEAEDEHTVWGSRVLPVMANLSAESADIWSYAFTEMVNNATNHSEGNEVHVGVWQSAIDSFIVVKDDGVGIFNKIQCGLGLHNKRDAIVELMKGGTTTDRKNHTGLGIFYSSQMMNAFVIMSEEIKFTRLIEDEDFSIAEDEMRSLNPNSGTWVFMRLQNKNKLSLKQFFDRIAPDIETSQPAIGELQLHVVEKNGQKLISRSQAKMLMARMETYKQVILDFEGVEFIGQAFADQIFRIFSREHPNVKILPKNTTKEVMRMIKGAIMLGQKEKLALATSVK